MPTEYFEQRERALLGPRYEQLYAAPQEAAERGVTVSGPARDAGAVCAESGLPAGSVAFLQSGLLWCMRRSSNPDATRTTTRACSTRRSRRRPRQPRCWECSPACGYWTCARPPGGKSSQLAAALQGRGVLVSNEYVAARAEILKSNLERMGVPNAVVLNETPARIAEALPEFFDRVLVDAPCSGEGMFRKEPVARQQHCEALVKQCAELGAQILDCAAAALAPGGQLVYSTCTFAPEEDEGQVAAFLQRHPEFELADALGNVDYTFGSEGEANRTGGLPLDVRKVRRIWPCQGGEGHFMARLVKAGTPRTLPAAGEYTRKNCSGWTPQPPPVKRARARAANRPESRTPVRPAGPTAAPAGMPCRAGAAAAGTPGQGRPPRPRAWLRGRSSRRSISRHWPDVPLWCTGAACCCRCPSLRPACMCCGPGCSWAAYKKAALCRSTTCSQPSGRSAPTARS